MKKIGIATITFTKNKDIPHNYGNVFQNYALATFLKKEGYYVNTIYYKPTYYEELTSQLRKKKSISPLQFIDDVLRIINRNIKKKKINSLRKKRWDLFHDFIEENIEYSDLEYCMDSNFEELDKLYDYYITGSDQVWNPYYEGANEFYYLKFVSQKKKRIAYAPSIAVPEIPIQLKKAYGNWISDIPHLSVRESSAKDLLEREYGIKATVVCDPVFLLTKEEWKDISVFPTITEKYFLVYILGKKDVSMKKKIKRLEKKYGKKAIDIFTYDNPNSFFAGPKEFIGMIENAEFIVTNSFHGVAFSIIFNKSIVLVDRFSGEDMSSRIRDILSLVDVGDRNIDSIMGGRIPLYTYYEQANLKKLIDHSKYFLHEALNQ